jgi:hypothetical protein
MAESKSTMARVDKLERESREFKRAVAQIADILVDHGERFDFLGKRIDDLGRTLGARFDGLETRLDGFGMRLDSLGTRLDRLIAVTIQDRTDSVERFADIERRLARLEERKGI